MIENEMTVSVPLEVVKASEIEPKEVKWLWYPYIPFGKVTLLQGDPGDGKSKLMLSIAALLSKGEPLPFTETEENEPMTIIYQTTEDDADDTVVPRFNSAGGNGENLTTIIFTLWFCLWWRKKSYGASVAKMKNCEEQLRKLFIKSAIQRNGNRIFR